MRNVSWVPVSDEFPVDGRDCLVSVDDALFLGLEFVTIARYFRTEGCDVDEGHWYGVDDEIVEEVVAWMPLPPTYKPRERDSNTYL